MPNRQLICINCGSGKWMSQKQFKERVTKEGSGYKVKRRFRCSKCISLEKKDLFTYQLKYGKPIKKIKAEMRKCLKEFYETNDIQKLQANFNEIFLKNSIDPSSVIYHKSNTGMLEGVTVKGMPFVGELYISIYKQRKYDKTSPKYEKSNEKRKE